MSLNSPAPDAAPSTPVPAPTPGAHRTISLTLAVVLIIVVAAVGIGATAAYYALKPTPTSGGPGTVTVVDDLGRTVVAPVGASRLVVLAPSVMDIVYRLGLRSDVVGVGCTTSISGGILNEYSPNQTTLWGLSNASCITDFPSLNTEGVANDTPQLVLASTITSEAAVDTLTATYKIPVVILAPATLEGIIGDVRLVAQLYPSSASTAVTLESQLSGTIASVTAEDTNLSYLPAAVPSVLISYYFDSGGYYTYGPGTFGASLIDLAGGTNIADSTTLAYGEMNATVVLSDQPQVLVYGTSWNDPYIVSGETTSVWATAPYFPQLHGSKVAVDVTEISEPDPSMILYLPWLQHALYPSLVAAP